ncbi:hypothetical protein KL86SPO_70096 [uncultured Sporomusa sp.]|uniref:Uncharacterized protein n=1 Tax=uncultured Sporomusa sp. TaxID=307249 RepID=A0A212M0D1_9FIRM|nr:hypothetical protein KL86SPO_70096 [uncultured Sporomusa sp.]
MSRVSYHFFCPDENLVCIGILVKERNYGEIVKEREFVISRTKMSEEGER